MSTASGTPLVIGFENVTIVREKRRLLEDASGLVNGGRLTAIVSCCGARGDFYLLSALAGQEEVFAGSILANGTPVVAPSYRSSAVLIDRDFTTFDELTVRQNLQYSASMRVASTANSSASVDNVIEKLGLEPVENKEIRNCAQHFRRRVSLGKELLLNPLAIFIDAAVQGLPTHEARQYLHTLRQIARETQRAIVISAVQPRWALLELTDDVIMIEGRRVVFCGSTAALLAAVRLDSEQIPESALNAVYRMATSPETSLYDAFVQNGSVRQNQAQVGQFMGQCAQGRLILQASSKVRPHPAVQFVFLLQYSIRQLRNNVLAYSTLFAVLLIFSILLAAVYSSQTGQSGMQNRIGIIFFLISSTFLHNILFVDYRRKAYLSFQRHREHGYYGPATFLAFDVTTSAFIRFFTSAVFTIVVYSLGNIENEWEYTNLRDLVFIVALTSFSTYLLVYFICAISFTTRMAHFALFALYTFNVILAGIILNVNTLPKPFQMLSFASLIRLGYESAVLTQFQGQDFGCATSNMTTSCYTGDQYISFLGFNEDRKWKNVNVLSIISASLIVVTYLVVVFYRPPRKISS